MCRTPVQEQDACDIHNKPSDLTVKFFSISSGSSGNCYYLGTETDAILIDAGMPFRTIKETLRSNGLSPDVVPIRALLITHDHTDHIRGATMVSASYGCPVYATEPVHKGMDRNYGLSKKIPTASRRYVLKDETSEIFGFRVTPFSVPHDSNDCVGYYIEIGQGDDIVRFCLVTDCGKITSDVRHYLAKADHIVVESNHDIDKLMNGSYPDYLKKRVRGEGGHTSNRECAELLHDIYHKQLRHVFLCHLSHENNDPDLAYRTAAKALQSEGAVIGEDIVLSVLMRNSPSLIYTLSEKR